MYRKKLFVCDRKTCIIKNIYSVITIKEILCNNQPRVVLLRIQFSTDNKMYFLLDFSFYIIKMRFFRN